MANDQLFKKRQAERAATKANMQRRSVNRVPETRVLIVTEGAQTEVRYLRQLIESMELKGVFVEVTGDCGSAPISVVNYAESKIDAEGKNNISSYDYVYCVFDRDTHETFETALSKILSIKKRKKIHIEAITSTPCIEVWFIFHLKYMRSPFQGGGNKSAAQKAMDYLKTLNGFEDYEKSINDKHITSLIKNTDTAIANAKAANDDIDITGEENPSSTMYKLMNFFKEKKETSEIERKKSQL